MNLSRLCGAILTLSFLTIQADANPSTLYTLSYNFPISGNGSGPDGGGVSATLINGVTSQNIEIFCDDFAHQMWAPYGPPTYPGYTDVNVSNLTTGSDLSLTRFGGVTSWVNVNIAGDTTDSNTINSASAIARYQMAAFLVTQYHQSDIPSDNAYNEGVQEAIWTLMDPAGLSADSTASPSTLPNIGNATNPLKQAAQWYTNPNSNKTFLADFHILSESVMYSCGSGLRCGGFQEQLYDPMPMPTVPEPRAQVAVLLGLLAVCAYKYQTRLKNS